MNLLVIKDDEDDEGDEDDVADVGRLTILDAEFP